MKILYEHAGSANHGCEAIVSSMLEKWKEKDPQGNFPVMLVTHDRQQDLRYSLSSFAGEGKLSLIQERILDQNRMAHLYYAALKKLAGRKSAYARYRFRDALREADARTMAIAIGGDNYCYPEMVQELIRAHALFSQKAGSTVLFGASVEEEMVRNSKELRSDLTSYDRIYARESLSYQTLLEAGIPEEKVLLFPDPAFTLPAEKSGPAEAGEGRSHLPEAAFSSGIRGLEGREVIGLNLSPMAQALEKKAGLTTEAYRHLIRFLLQQTEVGIALIPHVVWKNNDDRLPLSLLEAEFRESGRVFLVPDMDCRKLKGIIAGCSFFVGARTHATIAAYSSCVPTLVLGYSVKSRGIARDLLGTEEGTVCPVQKLGAKEELTAAFRNLYDKKEELALRLKAEMPDYSRRAGEGILSLS